MRQSAANIRIKEVVLRPLAVFCLTYYIFACSVRYAAADVKLCLVSAFTAAFLVLTVFRAAMRKRLTVSRRAYARALSALCIGAVLSSMAAFAAFDVYLEGLEEKYCGEKAEIVALVEDVRFSNSFSASYTVKTRSIDGESISLRLSLDAEPGLVPGNVIRTEAVIAAIDRSGGILGESEFLLGDGVRLCAEGSDIGMIEYSCVTPRIFMSGFNTRLTNILCDIRAGEDSGIAAALFLGNRSRLSPSVARDFSRLGISHILALSGMHLSIVCAAVSALAGRLGARGRRIVCAAVTVGYIILTGASPSVCRAGIMLLAMFGANLSGRGGDSFTDLGIAVFLLSVTDPFSAGGVSLELSAAAVFAILLQTGRRNKISSVAQKTRCRVLRLLRSLFEDAKMTVSVVIFTLPLMWLYFGSVSIVSPLTSVVFSMLATAVLYISPIALAAAPTAHMSGIIFGMEGALCSLCARLASRISALRGIVVPLSGTFVLVLCILCSVSFTAFSIARGRMRKISAAAAALALVFTLAFGAAANSRSGEVFITAVNNKSNDGLVVGSEGRTMIIDISNGSKTSLYNAVSLAGEAEIEAIMLTHSHTTYPSALAHVMEREMVRCLIVPDGMGETVLARLRDICIQNDVIFEIYSPGEVIAFGEARIKTYEDLKLARSAQPIVRVDVSAFGESFTYLGAAYTEACADVEIDPGAFVWLGCHGPKYKKECVLPQELCGRIMAVGSAAGFAPPGAEELSSCVLRKMSDTDLEKGSTVSDIQKVY